MKWGLIGCGDMAAKTTAPSILRVPGCRLVAVCGRHRDRTRAFADRFGIPTATTRVEELADDPEVDAVFISTPVARHCEQTLACLRRGKHVLCEKPLALTAEEALQMAEAARDAGRLLSAAYYRRAFPQTQAIKRFLDDGAIGRLLLLQFHFGTLYRPDPASRGAWRLDPHVSGGGVIPDIGCHRIDLARYLGGAFETVGGSAGRHVPGWKVEDTASILIEFQSGAQASIHVSFSQAVKQDRVSLHGTEGSIVADPFDEGRFVLTREETTLTQSCPPPSKEARQAALIENFAAAARGDARVLCPAQEAVDTNWAIDVILNPEQVSDFQRT